MEEILDLAKRVAEEAEVYQINSSYTPVSFEANKLKQMETKETRGAALRLVRNGRVGFSATTDLRDPMKLVNDALAVAELGAEAKFHFPSAAIKREIQVYDPLVEGLEVGAMIDLGRGVIEKVLAYNSSILCDVGISKHVEEVLLINSRGGEAAYKKTAMAGSVHGNLMRDTEMLDVYDERVACQLAASYDDLAEKLIESLEQAKRVATAPTKSMPVLFTPKGIAGTLMLPLQAALNGKTVLQGASALGDRLEQRVFDPRVTIIDDGTLDFAPRSAVCDDEGVATRRTPIVEQGVLKNFYYDLQTAGLAGRESTGNGFRSLYSLPSPSPTSVLVAEGHDAFEDMVKGVKEGILVDQVMGAWAGNVLSGDFSANVHLGYKIENGQIAGRVKDTMVAGNVFEALKNGLEAIGKEAVWIHGSLKVPALLFKSISVSTKH